MASEDQLKALVKSHINRDGGQFYSVAMQVAAHEAKVVHGKLAEELRAMIDAAKARAQPGRAVHFGQPRGELANLLHVSYPTSRMSDMVLEPDVSHQLIRIIKEQRQFARLREHSLSPRRKLLLVGPPGTGWTDDLSLLPADSALPFS
jgi:SpoVK/Ycf46/Vps4 family AAA+-type ATPase